MCFGFFSCLYLMERGGKWMEVVNSFAHRCFSCATEAESQTCMEILLSCCFRFTMHRVSVAGMNINGH